MANILFNIGVAGTAAATANIDGVIARFDRLRTAAYGAVSASEDYYDVVNRLAVDMRQFNQETKGLIDTMTSVRQANALTAAGVKITGEEMSALGKFASEFAQATGQDVTATFERLTESVIRGTSRGLIPFGIQIAETTDKSKAQAEALALITQKAEGLTVKTDDLNEQVYAFKNTIGTLRDQLAAPLFDNLISGLSGTAGGLAEASTALSRFSDDLTAGGQQFASWATSAEGFGNIVSGVWAEITGDTEEATRKAREYYETLQRAKAAERNRRTEQNINNMVSARGGWAQLEQDAALGLDMTFSDEEAEAALAAYKKRKRGGGGRKKEKPKIYEGFDSGLSGENIFDVTDLSDIESAMGAARADAVQLQMDLLNQEIDQRLAKYDEENQRMIQMEADKYAAMNDVARQHYDAVQQWEAMSNQQQVEGYANATALVGQQLGSIASMMDTSYQYNANLSKKQNKENEKHARHNFEVAKGLQLAQSTMTLPQAVLNAWNTGMQFGPAGVVMAPLLASLTTGLGIAQIAMISRAKWGGGGGGGTTNNYSSTSINAGAPQYGAGRESGGGLTIQNNFVVDGTVIHSSVIRANDGAAQRGERSFATQAA